MDHSFSTNFPKKYYLLPIDTHAYVCVSGVRNVSFPEHFACVRNKCPTKNATPIYTKEHDPTFFHVLWLLLNFQKIRSLPITTSLPLIQARE